MPHKYKKSLFIFRRDLRLHDNTTLIEALKNSETVIPIFIFTKIQLGDSNKYRSHNCIQFMIECLKELDNSLRALGSKLNFFHGDNETIIEKLINDEEIDCVFFNRDYTKFSVKRDTAIANICKKHDIDCLNQDDLLLNEMNTVLTSSGTPFLKFTPFFNTARKMKVREPIKNKYKNYMPKRVKLFGSYDKDIDNIKTVPDNKNIYVHGGRELALKILLNISSHRKYNTTRNMLNTPTTGLSAYFKFGCISIREAYYVFKKKLGTSNDLIKQLYWRDFYFGIAYNHPEVFGSALSHNYNKLKWSNNKSDFNKWCEGKTGVPIVDAGMRQLNTTGIMHNRARLITANFLVKLLQQSWLSGEKYYATRLVDYDASINNGNWQWNSSTSPTCQKPYVIFNSWTQGATYDHDCEYIKKWIPELKDVDAKDIHNWDTTYSKYPNVKYPKPMIDYVKAKEKTLKMYRAIFKN
jgi:deoxyribodipyrimidine photo-lyase